MQKEVTVEDDEGYQAVFAEQPSAAVQVAAAKIPSLAYRGRQETRMTRYPLAIQFACRKHIDF